MAYPRGGLIERKEMKPKVFFGPYLVAAPMPGIAHETVRPLGVTVEWATSTAAPRIALFSKNSQQRGAVRLEHILVNIEQLPFSIECYEFSVIEHSAGIFLPLESVLAHLYQTHNGARCIFDLLGDLTNRIPVQNTLVRPLNRHGLLVPEVECRGYFLNTFLAGDQGFIAEIAWRTRGSHVSFHVGLCKFRPNEPIGGAQWVSSGSIGVSELLLRELRRSAAGNPTNLFTPLGLELASQLADAARQQLTA
jgi:hypothetical protein